MKLKDFVFLLSGFILGIYLSIAGYKNIFGVEILNSFLLFLFPLIIFISFIVKEESKTLQFFLFSFIFGVLFIAIFCILVDKEKYINIEKYVLIYTFSGVFGRIFRTYLKMKKEES